MRFYHGTIAEFAEGIKREGLMGKDENAFNIRHAYTGYNLRDADVEGRSIPHVTTRKQHALEYAKFRAKYEGSKLGTPLTFTHHGVGVTAPFVKEARAQREASPALVRFDIPKEWAKQHLEEDVQDPWGLVAQVPIPAEFVKGVEPVEMEAL